MILKFFIVQSSSKTDLLECHKNIILYSLYITSCYFKNKSVFISRGVFFFFFNYDHICTYYMSISKKMDFCELLYYTK